MADPPVTTIFDEECVGELIRLAANAFSMQLCIRSEWKEDDSWSSRLVSAVNTINPAAGIRNLITDGQWTNPTSGAFEVGYVGGNDRRRTLFEEFTRDLWAGYEARLPRGPAEVLAYLEHLTEQTKKAWAAIAEQFKFAININKEVSSSLNDALDRTYKIRTVASIAFVIVGSLPVATAAAGGAAAAAPAFLSTQITLTASTGAWWAVALKVAGVGGIYGFLTEMAFNKDDIKRSSVACHLSDSGKAAALGTGGNLAQTAVERVRAHGTAQLLEEARSRNAQQVVRDTLLRLHAQEGGRVDPRLLSNEVQRRCSRQLAGHAEKNLSRVAKSVARSGSVFFTLGGLYMMSDEIGLACRGLTAEIDRTR
jgi:hypothetical protein